MGTIIGKDKLRLLISFLLVIFCMTATDCYAATRDIELLDTGYRHYLLYQPEKAAEEFRTFLKEFPQSSAKDAALYWLGMSLMQLREFREAEKVFTDLKQQFPESPFFSYAERELEAIGKAEHPPVQANKDEKAGATGEVRQNITRSPGQKIIPEEEKKKSDELMARVKEQEKDKQKGEASEAEERESEEADAELDTLQANGKEIRKTEKEAYALEETVKELEEEKKKTEALQGKVKELEEEKKRAGELQAKIRELEEEKRKADALQAKVRPVEEAKQTIREPKANQTETDEGKKKSGELEAKIKELDAEKKRAEELHIKIRELEGKESYILNSSLVLNKLGLKDVLWRSGNIQDDIINEKLLYQAAKELNIAEDPAKHGELTGKYKFNREQGDYLSRYLTICNFIDMRLMDMPEENVFEQLIVEYDEETRYTKIVLATELQTQAKSGMSFEEIYNLYPDLIIFRITGFDELPEWIQEKVGPLQSGELGVVWSAEGYRILKRSMKKITLKSCEEIRPETRDKIKAYINELLKEIKGETRSNEAAGGG